MAILVAMSLMDHVPLAEVKNHLSQVVERVQREHGRVVITKHGRPAAVLISIEDLESLEETLAVLSDPDLMASIRERSEEHTSELQSLMRISYAVFCLKKKNKKNAT